MARFEPLTDKQQKVLELVKLGMSMYKAQLIAGCDDDEMSSMNNDAYFSSRVELAKAHKEHELLNLHDEAIQNAIVRGDAKPIQWRLEKLDPEQYGKVVSTQLSGSLNTNLTGNVNIDTLSDDEKKSLNDEMKAVLKDEILSELSSSK